MIHDHKGNKNSRGIPIFRDECAKETKKKVEEFPLSFRSISCDEFPL